MGETGEVLIALAIVGVIVGVGYWLFFRARGRRSYLRQHGVRVIGKLTSVRGVTSALDHVRQNFNGDVLLVSSGGPIATAVAQVLAAPPATSIELNLRIRNTALTQFVFNPKRHQLLTYNTLPHLDGAEYRDWVTYA